MSLIDPDPDADAGRKVRCAFVLYSACRCRVKQGESVEEMGGLVARRISRYECLWEEKRDALGRGLEVEGRGCRKWMAMDGEMGRGEDVYLGDEYSVVSREMAEMEGRC